HALSEVLVAGGQLVQPGGQLIAAGGRAVGSAGELIETVGQLTGAIGGLAGAVRQAPHAAGELAGALGGLLGALVELLGSAVEFLHALIEVLGAAGELLRTVGGVGEAGFQVVDAEVEPVQVLLGHLSAHGGGGGLRDSAGDQGIDLPAGVVGGDLEDRRGGLGAADGGQVGGEVLRDHHDRAYVPSARPSRASLCSVSCQSKPVVSGA